MNKIDSLIQSAIDSYKYALENSDERTNDRFLVWKDPTAVLILFSLYLTIVYFGKKYMKDRKEIYVPPAILFIYNMALVLLSSYMFYELIVGMYQSEANIFCATLHSPNEKGEMRVINALYIYFLSKAVEFFDTFFMVIRKKFNQITFLHCYHHSTMLLIWWSCMMWWPCGQSYFGATFNSFIHILMYAYYALSVIPSLKDKLWWKKYITSLQLIQFFFTFTHVMSGIVRGCDYPKAGQYFLAFYMITLIILFTNFYVHEYIHKSNKRKANKKVNDEKQKLNGSPASHQSLNGHHEIKKIK